MKEPIWVHVLEAGQQMTGSVRKPDGTTEPFTVTFSTGDIDTLVESFDPVGKTKAVLGVDHRGSGPCYGLFTAVKRVGTSMFAALSDLNARAEEAIRTKAFHSLSSNIDLDYHGTGKPYFLGADLLGAKIPAMAGGLPIELATGDRIASFAADVQQVEIVFPESDYQAGDLKNALLSEQAEDRAETVISKARSLIDGVWYSTKPVRDKIAAVIQILTDAAPLLDDASIIPDSEDCDMTEAQMASFASTVAAATATAIADTLKARDAELVASFGASLKTATVAMAADADLDAKAEQFAKDHTGPAASPARRLALAASYKAAAALDAVPEGETAPGAVAELVAMFASGAPTPPSGESAPNNQHESVEAKRFLLTLGDGSTKRVELSASATPEHQEHVAAAVEYANTHGIDFADAMIITAPSIASA